MDSIANVSVMVNDTIEYLEKSDVIAFYSDMMDKQATQFAIIVSVISAVFVIATGATWWWNSRGAKQQIKDEVNTAKQVLNKLYKNHQKAIENILKNYENEFNEFKGSLQESVNLQIENKINEINYLYIIDENINVILNLNLYLRNIILFTIFIVIEHKMNIYVKIIPTDNLQ